jgi:hypothetical protein
MGRDGGERRVLNRREVVAGGLDLGMKDRHRDLLEPPCQVARFIAVVDHQTLQVGSTLDKHTDDQHTYQVARGPIGRFRAISPERI